MAPVIQIKNSTTNGQSPSTLLPGELALNRTDGKLFYLNNLNQIVSFSGYVHPTGDGYSHVPATGTTNNGKVLMAGATPNSAAWRTLTKTDVGLGNVDNTSDANKPVSTLQQAQLDLKVDKQTGLQLSQNSFTNAEKTKLASLEDSHFRGTFRSLAALQAAIPVGKAGDYADVDTTPGNDMARCIWDTTNSQWVQQAGAYTQLTASQVKTLYEANPNTNAFTDAEKTKLAGIEAQANKYVHPTGDGNLHVPATGTTSNGKVLTAGATAGSISWKTLTASDISDLSTVGVGKLATAQLINGTPFDGTAAITTAQWGTARNFTIGNATKSVNGSANVAFTMSEIGAIDLTSTQTITNKILGAGTVEAVTTGSVISISTTTTPFSQVTLAANNTASVVLPIGVSRTLWVNPGTYTVTWPAVIQWVGGTAPTLTASKWNLITFTGTPAGTGAIGSYLGALA